MTGRIENELLFRDAPVDTHSRGPIERRIDLKIGTVEVFADVNLYAAELTLTDVKTSQSTYASVGFNKSAGAPLGGGRQF